MQSSSRARARARLRRTFRYPDDSDPIHLDEQEQEALINQLSVQNALQNTLFNRLLLILPIATTTPYIPLVFRFQDPVVALLSITSLLSTAFLLYKLPPGTTGIAPLDAWARKEDALEASRDAASRLKRQARRLRRGLEYDKSPLELCLPYLNLGMVMVLAFMGMATTIGKQHTGSFAWIGIGNLPGIVYLVVLLANVVMGGVDPEKELSALKYDYRGA